MIVDKTKKIIPVTTYIEETRYTLSDLSEEDVVYLRQLTGRSNSNFAQKVTGNPNYDSYALYIALFQALPTEKQPQVPCGWSFIKD